MGKTTRFGSGMEEEPDPDYERRLEALGVPLAVLQEAIRAGQLNADFCTTGHPRTYPGIVAWGETIGTLRRLLGGLGWTFNDDENIPRVVSEDGSVVITCISGNDDTGIRKGVAGTRNPRRSAGLRILRRNAQTEMVELLPEGEKGRRVVLSGKTWFLLYRRDGDVVRNELTLATAARSDGKLLEWSERLILPPVSLHDGVGGPGGGPDGSTVTPMPPVDVPIERRAG